MMALLLHRTCFTLVCSVAAILCWMCFWSAFNSATDGTRPEVVHAAFPLSVDESHLDLGTMWAQDGVEQAIPILNSSEMAVEIVKFQGSCGCFSVVPKTVTIAAGATEQIKLSLDLARYSRPSDSKPTPVALELTPILRDWVDKPQNWILKGHVRSFAQIEPPSVNLGTHSAREGKFPRVSIRVDYPVPVAALAAECIQDYAHVWTESVNNGNVRFIVFLEPRQGIPLGPIDFRVTLTPELANGSVGPKSLIPVSGRMVTDVEAMPERVFLGVQPVRGVIESKLLFRSRTGRRFRIVVTAKTGNLSADLLSPVGTGSAVAYRVKCPTIEEGFNTSRLEAHIVHDDGLRELVEVPVQYIGVSANGPSNTGKGAHK